MFVLVTDLNCKPLYKPNTDNMDSDGYVRLYKVLIDSLERCTTFKSKDLFMNSPSTNDRKFVKFAMLYFLEAVVLRKDPRTKVQVKRVQHTDIF